LWEKLWGFDKGDSGWYWNGILGDWGRMERWWEVRSINITGAISKIYWAAPLTQPIRTAPVSQREQYQRHAVDICSYTQNKRKKNRKTITQQPQHIPHNTQNPQTFPIVLQEQPYGCLIPQNIKINKGFLLGK
jgi:hypothetical protein